MIDLKVLKPNVVYRMQTTFRLPTEMKDPSHGSVYMAVTKTPDGTASFFSHPRLAGRFLSKYLTNRIYNYRIYNLLIKYRVKDGELKQEFNTKIKPKLPALDLAMTPVVLARRNYIYDFSQFNERFFATNDTRIGLRRVNEYFRLFKLFTVDKVNQTQYTNRVLFIPIYDWVKTTRDTKLFRIQNTDNFISLFYLKLVNDPDYFKTNFAGWKFYFTTDTQCLYWRPDDIHAKSAEELVALLKRFRPDGKQDTTVTDEAGQEDIETNAATNRTLIADQVSQNLVASNIEPTDQLVGALTDKVIEKTGINLYLPNPPSIDVSKVISPKEIELEQVQETMEQIVPKSRARLARETKLIEDMKNISFDGMTLDEITARAKANTIETTKFPVDVINPSLAEMKFPNFDEAYLKNLYKADIVKIVTSFQYKDKPLYLFETEVKDASDALNDLEEYVFRFEDEEGRRHTFSILMPKFTDNRTMKIGGNTKIMSNQIIPLPIIKTRPDTVQISTNYQKVFIHRFGQQISPKISMLFKSLGELMNKEIKIEIGEASSSNRQYIRTIEYDELASRYRRIILPHTEIHFNQNVIRDEIKKLGITGTIPDNAIPVAIKNKRPIFLNTETNLISAADSSAVEMDLVDFIVNEISSADQSFKSAFSSMKPAKKFMYSRADIMAKKVPIVILLGYLDGLIGLMKRAKIDYRIITKDVTRRNLDVNTKREAVIEFEDAWLVYPIYPLRNSLLLNGFMEIPTKIYRIEQFLSKDVYHELFETLFGRKNIGYAFENFQQLLIDPITEDVLRDYGLPTDFIDVFLYANTLLEDNAFNEDSDLDVHRVRSNEMVAAFMYKSLAEAYEQYRFTANNPNPTRVSTRKDSAIVNMLTSQVTKDFSRLNPIYTLELKSSSTWKGPGGMNVDRAFNLSKRAYHPSMIGVLSQASPISSAIGIARTLTLDANVISARGYIQTSKTKEDINKLPTTKLISAAEALVPFGVTSDDPERTAMTSAQSRHTIACIGSQRAPLETGFEKILPHLIGDTFVYKAKDDGKIIKIDESTNLMVIRYRDGKIETVNLNPEMGKNSGSGFYISNKLSPLFKTGDTFKKDTILAHNKDFFTIDKRSGNPVFMTGPLARIAFRYSPKVIEDSTVLSTRLAEKMSSYIVIEKEVTLGRNSNVSFMIKKGQNIDVNEPLIIFDTSHTDELTNKVLAKIGEDSTKDLLEASKTPITSKHKGVIEDIKIYYTVPKDELSDSMRKIIEGYETENENLIKATVKDTGLKHEEVKISLTQVEQITPDLSGKVKGVKVGEGVLIQFYIKYKDIFGVGDKLTSFVATKAIACDVFKDGEEPYLLSDPTDKIDLYSGVISVGARMVMSLLKSAQVNGVLIGAKKNVAKMYEEIYGEKLK